MIIAREGLEGCEVAPKTKQKLVMQMRNFDGEGEQRMFGFLSQTS